MSENPSQQAASDVVAVIDHPEMVQASTDSWMAVYHGDMRALAFDICSTDFVPKGFRGKKEAALAAMLFGREIGLPPVAALQGLYSVDGRVGLYAETQRALVLQAGHEYRIVTQDASRCVIEARRAGQEEWARFSFTLQEAKDAGLAGKDNWKKHPQDMLLARATARMCRALFPDVIHGMGSAEELQDQAAPAAVTVTQVDTKTGEVVAEASSAPPKTSRVSHRKQETPAGPEPERQKVGLRPASSSAQPKPDAEIVDAEIVDAEIVADAESAAQPSIITDGEPAPRIGQATVGMIVQHFNRLGVTDRAERLMWTGLLAGHEGIDSSNKLTQPEGAKVLKAIEKMRDRDALEAWEG